MENNRGGIALMPAYKNILLSRIQIELDNIFGKGVEIIRFDLNEEPRCDNNKIIVTGRLTYSRDFLVTLKSYPRPELSIIVCATIDAQLADHPACSIKFSSNYNEENFVMKIPTDTAQYYLQNGSTIIIPRTGYYEPKQE